MPLHTLKPVLGRLTRTAHLCGSFCPNSTSAVDATKNKGKGFSVARTDVGKFVVTLDDNYPDIVAVVASLGCATLNAGVRIIDVTPGSGTTRGTFTLQVLTPTTGAALELSATAQNRVHFMVDLRDGSP